MEAVGKSCKFCLTYIQGNGSITLNDKILDKLDFLQIDLDQSAKESNFLCKKCERQIENAFNFKMLLANSIELSGSHDISQNTPNTSTDKMSIEKIICHLCKNSVDKLSIIHLSKLLKDDGMVEVFQGHIQEVDLENIAENSVVCETCQKSLVNFWILVELWLKIDYCNDDMDSGDMLEVKEENLDRLVEGALVDSPCTFEVSNSAGNNLNTKKVKSEKRQMTNNDASESCNKTIKTEISESGESVLLNCKGVKKEATEEHEEATMEELELKNEELIIKDEDRLLVDSTQHAVLPAEEPCKRKNKVNGNKINKKVDEVPVKKCKDFSKNCITDKNKSLVYRCKTCFYKTENKSQLEIHLLRHKSLVYKCGKCRYETENKSQLKIHLLTHKSSDKVEVYTCNECLYVSKYKQSLKNHLLSHKNLDEVEVYTCKECSFVTKYKCNLKVHLSTHKSSDDVKHIHSKNVH